MNDILENLQGVLARELAIYGELAKLAEQQREALIYRRTGALTEIAVDQTRLIAKSVRLDQQARELLSQAGASSISEVAACVEDSAAQPVLDLRDQIISSAKQLGRMNRINAELFENAMDAIRFTIQVLADANQAPEPCYAFTESSRRGNAFMLDQHA